MTMVNLINDERRVFPKHPQIWLWPSEVVMLRVLHALKEVGYKFCLLINQWGGIVGWLHTLAHVHDIRFHPLIRLAFTVTPSI